MAKIISICSDVADPVTKPVVQTQPSSGAVEYVGNMTLTCLMEGGTRLVYQWLKNGRPVHTSSTNSFSLQNSSLHIVPVTKEDIGNYSCLVKNPISEMESDIIMPTIYCKFFKIYTYTWVFFWEVFTRWVTENITRCWHQMSFGFHHHCNVVLGTIILPRHCLVMKYSYLYNPVSWKSSWDIGQGPFRIHSLTQCMCDLNSSGK